jgi:hypothetical protein
MKVRFQIGAEILVFKTFLLFCSSLRISKLRGLSVSDFSINKKGKKLGF